MSFLVCFFFFKQKTAYEMRISDWSSDVCSSDLPNRMRFRLPLALALPLAFVAAAGAQPAPRPNIVYIMSDDHAYQAISAYGSPLSKLATTPNIHRIATNRPNFPQSFVGTSVFWPMRRREHDE